MSWPRTWRSCKHGALLSLGERFVIIALQVDCNGRSERFYVRYMGVKGDWPFLRAAMRLQTGYSSSRICHLCHAEESWLGNSVEYLA